jgi:hypothetical protein
LSCSDRPGAGAREQPSHRRLPSSHLEVSELSTVAGGVGLEQTRAGTEAALKAGSDLFDTANVSDPADRGLSAAQLAT